MKTILLLWVIVLAFTLPHGFILALFWLFVTVLGLACGAFLLVILFGFGYLWHSYRQLS